MLIKLAIKNRWTGSIIFEFETEGNTMRKTVEAYIKKELESKYRADLTDADLTDADLTRANLTDADLTDANLTDADLTDADLTRADLTVFKHDLFIVLLHAIPEVKFLKENIIAGKIDGSTYDGKCACLSGTLANGCKVHNGENEQKVYKNIIDCRDSARPIERLFLSIKVGDTPENSNLCKIVLGWIDEFEHLIAFTNTTK